RERREAVRAPPAAADASSRRRLRRTNAYQSPFSSASMFRTLLSGPSRRFFAAPSTFNWVTPVTLPPGRLRLGTRPILIGSEAVSKRIGMVVAVAFAASAAGVLVAAITATRRRTRSATIAGSRSFLASAQRYSIATL